MEDRKIIRDLLTRVARRLSFNRRLQELGFGLCLVFLALLTFQLARPALTAPPFGSAYAVSAAVAVALAVLYVLRRALRRATLTQAAGMVDARAQLHDELKTACWLSSQPDDSPFAQVQIARAARTTQRIDPARIVPARIPRSIWSALLLGALAILASAWVPDTARPWQAAHASAAQAASEPISALLEGTADDESTRKLRKALDVLQSESASAAQRQRALAQAREAQDEINLKAARARETLDRLGALMAARDDDLKQAGQALQQGRTAAAEAMLKRLSRDADPDRRDDADAQGGPGAAGSDSTALADEPHRADLKINQDAISEALRNIQDAQGAIETQSRANQTRRRMEDFLVASSQRSPLTAARFGNQASSANPTPAPETGNANLQGGTMFRQGAVAQGEDSKDAEGGSETGAAAGDAEALRVEGTRTERLEAKLKRESLMSAGEAQDDAGEQSWIYKPTQGDAAQTGFAEVRGRGSYAAAQAPEREHIPVRQQGMVRDYFIDLHHSGQQGKP